ncbi:MAG: aminotransferase class I/II-fold pyridoxal phosphate-dependent enzyme [Chloroflexi bacterium]|nr:aminotransferase class I/II-fold pyridoxal phosphate-dependent enzyme [Chloroflexota bacterium]MBV9602243.1 aminotransferase class I/II-fold pyridoxal phosphate-dependent enzyme [Chloroflexota bacterium]
MRFDTLAVHAGAPSFTIDGAHPTAPPLVPASSYWYDSADELDRVLGDQQPGYSYARYASPTVVAFEEAVAALEGAAASVAFASGMAAIHAAVRQFAPSAGGTVFVSNDCYGGTFTLLGSTLNREGLTVRFTDVYDVGALEARLRQERPSALLVEVVSNPLERVADLVAIARLCTTYGVALIVDSTFTTPYLIKPLSLGAACVVHSATKYLGGHGDVTGGVVACASAEQAASMRNWRKYTGSVLGVLEAYLCVRGIRTLPLRVARQCANAAAVARALAADQRVERVYYPGLAENRDHPTACRLFPEGLFGAVLAFGIRDADRSAVMRFLERLELVRAAPTLGDCFSLVLYPVIASHRGLTQDERRERGIHDNVVRFSAGLEDPADLIADFDHALSGLVV